MRRRRMLPLVNVAFIVLIAISALVSGINFVWLTEIVRQAGRTSALARSLAEGYRSLDAARESGILEPGLLASRQAHLAAMSDELAQRVSSTSRHSIRAMAAVAIAAFGTIVAGAAVMILVTRRIARPLRLLLEANERVAQGELDHQVVYEASDEMGALAHSFNRMVRCLRRSVDEVVKQKQTLGARVAEATADYREQSLTDEVTGLPNLRHLRKTFRRTLADAQRTDAPFVVVTAYIVGLEGINAHFGREAGDLVVTAAGRCLRGAAREVDFVARYAGATFVLLLPGIEAAPEAFRRRLDAQLKALGNAVRLRTKRDVRVDFRMGSARFPADGQSFYELLAAADRDRTGGDGSAGAPRAAVADTAPWKGTD